MPESVLDEISHRRYNPLKDTWILVSPHRTKRPWQGQQEAASKTTLPAYDPSCYLCPGNKRAQGDINPKYENTFVFINDYSAVKEQQAEYSSEEREDALSSTLLRAEPVTGKCYVITFSPMHNLTLADLEVEQIIPVIEKWTQIYTAHLDPKSPIATAASSSRPLSESPDTQFSTPNTQYRYMQVFENKGAAMGCSNPHPHGQIWTVTGLPDEPATELATFQRYRHDHNNHHLLADYASLELSKHDRLVFRNETFIAVVPWWALWPFEILILPLTHLRALPDLSPIQRQHLAEAIADVVRRYDNLFETHFPYSMGVHQAPLTGGEEEIEASYLHVHFYPPLLRSATVRKFLVGYEMLSEPQRDLTPEQAAGRLRGCGGVLYRKTLS